MTQSDLIGVRVPKHSGSFGVLVLNLVEILLLAQHAPVLDSIQNDLRHSLGIYHGS